MDSETGSLYQRIYNDKSKKPVFRSLEISDKVHALAASHLLFFEAKEKLDRNEQLNAPTTSELIARRMPHIDSIMSKIPCQGAMPENARLKCYYLKNWQEFINQLGLTRVQIDKIASEKYVDLANACSPKAWSTGRVRQGGEVHHSIQWTLLMRSGWAPRFRK